MRLLLLVLLAAGCGFHTVGGHDGSAAGDMGVPAGDLAGVDPAGGDLGTASLVCGRPQLLVGVENLQNPATGGGRIARLSLTGAAATPCATLTGQGLIGSQPMAVAAFGAYVAAVTLDGGIYAVDPATDLVKWTRQVTLPSGWGPLDAFAVSSPAAQPMVAAAFGLYDNPSTVREIDVYDVDGASPASSPWCIQETGCGADLPLGLQILGVSADPKAPSHLLALDGATPAAALDVDPWATPPTKTTYIGSYSGYLQSIAAVQVDKTPRLVWFDAYAPTSIRWANDDSGGTPLINGPLRCASGCTTILHAVPDPTSTTDFFLLCDGPSVDTRTVVRLDGSGNCTTVLDGAQFGSQSRLSRLAVAP